MPCSSPVVLQCSFPKSGSYGVHRVLAALLDGAGALRSYKERVGLASLAAAFGEGGLVFPEAAHVDAFSFASGACALEFPHPACRWLPVDPALLLDGSTLLWTHDPCEPTLRAELGAVTHRVYVLRDGRDVLDSLAHHAVRPEIRRLHPAYRHTTPAEVYADLGLFASWARRWAAHVESWLRHRERFALVRFEELAADPAAVVAKLAAALDLDADVGAIAAQASFASLRRDAPGHLRSGRPGVFRERFRAAHHRVFEREAGATLVAAGYALEEAAA